MMFRARHQTLRTAGEAALATLADPAGARESPSDASDANGGDASRGAENPTARLRRVIDHHYDSLWRTLRYLGVPEASVDDAAQQTLCVLARRLNDVESGAEVAFLFATAIRVASEARRSVRRNRAEPVQDVDSFPTTAASTEELVDQRRAREVLEQVLEAIPSDLRIVFVLFEIEELALAEIAGLLGIPTGTAASRLRRARESFQTVVRRRQAAERGGRR
jgi:RNA polymerase sigma-70 factor, ECF subfamily